MTRDVRAALGPRLAHVTARANLPGIMANGLHPAEDLAVRGTIDAAQLLLRTRRLTFSDGPHAVQLNHQRPIAQHLRAATAMLDGHSAKSWAAGLDRRVFFWPAQRGERFANSIARDSDIVTLWLNTDRLVEALAEQIDLSPINSGNFSQGGAHARRGDWTFVPLTAGLATFRTNRVRRGLVKSPDRVTEVSVRGAIPPDVLAHVLETN